MILRLLGVVTGRARTADDSSGLADTEFTAEVVRLTDISPHPNADRLEIARFELRGSGPSAYEVVIQRGTYRVGDLAAYFSVDCLLPTSHPEFAFLRDRLDGKDKAVFRLRAARLRGTFSQGLLVPAPFDEHGIGFEFGRSVAEHFGVTYHRGAEDSTPGTPTAATAKKKTQPWPIYGVESLKKVPRLFTPGEEVVVTEKIHGCNFRFGWIRRRFLGIPIGWTFRVGSHRVMKGVESRGAGWYGEDLWLDAARKMDLARKTRDYRGYLFVGELYGHTYSGKAIQDMTYGTDPSSGPRLAVFDVKAPGGHWVIPARRDWVLAETDLPRVPVLYRGPFEYETVALAEGMTTLNHSGRLDAPKSPHIREGVVIESADRSRKGKYVSTMYLLRKVA